MGKALPLVKVGFEFWYFGPKTPRVIKALKESAVADMDSWNDWLHVDVLPHDGEVGDIPDWVWEQLSEPCPHLDEDGHGSDCLVCEGDEQYFPGWEPEEDGEPNECSHEPEGHTITYSGSELICDVSCSKCGISGSFQVTPDDINWE